MLELKEDVFVGIDLAANPNNPTEWAVPAQQSLGNISFIKTSKF